MTDDPNQSAFNGLLTTAALCLAVVVWSLFGGDVALKVFVHIGLAAMLAWWLYVVVTIDK